MTHEFEIKTQLDWRHIGAEEMRYMGGMVLLDGSPVSEVFFVKIYENGQGELLTYDLHDHPSLINKHLLRPRTLAKDGHKPTTAISANGILGLLPPASIDIPMDIGITPDTPVYWLRRGKIQIFTNEEWMKATTEVAKWPTQH